MNKYLLLWIVVLTTTMFTSIYAENGWRESEMEIKVYLHNSEEVKKLQNLKLNGDLYPDAYLEGIGILYVTPDELNKIIDLNLSYEVVIADLNEHYKDYWDKRPDYHTYAQIIQLMDELSSTYPNLCKKTVYGSSLSNRELSAIKISDNVSVDENEGELIFDGGIHGDEVGGAENDILFAQEILSKYGSDATITDLIDNREIWLYCMINPDGRVSMTRYNANRIDCNRNWGYMTTMTAEGFSEPETRGLRDCLLENQFSIQVSYHSGVEYILYPWGLTGNQTPDKAHHDLLANVYAQTSGYDDLDVWQSYDTYHTTGETLDYAYGALGISALTMEISFAKQPTDITGFYQKNVDAMLAMIEYAGYGVEGTITDAVTRTPVGAVIVVNNSYPIYSDPEVGDYHKFVRAGTYSLKVFANGYKTKTVSNVAVQDKKSTVTDIQLEPEPGGTSTWGYRVVFVEEGDGITPDVLGSADNRTFTLRSSREMVIDMQYAIKNIDGSDFKCHGTNAASYTFYTGQGVDGPWKSLGTGSGIKEFDLSEGNLEEARYVKISGGCAIDAIEAIWDIPVPVVSNNSHLKPSLQLEVNALNKNITFNVRTDKPYTLRVYNIQGKLQWEANPSHITKNTWQPSSTGIYLVRLESGKDIVVKRFSVMR